MRYLFSAALLLASVILVAQTSDEKKILDILDTQTQAWNRGDLDQFMKGYWENDSLMFIGKSGVTYGYKNTLDNYKKGYPDRAAMGKLVFTIIQIKALSPEYYQIVGKWKLERGSLGDLNGHYTLLFKKINAEWLIISDHSS